MSASNDRALYPDHGRSPDRDRYRESGRLLDRGFNGFVRLQPVCSTCLRIVDGRPGDLHLCGGARGTP